MGAFVHFASRHPEAMGTWVSTCVIVLNHAQTFAVIGGLSLEWPPTLLEILRALQLDIAVAQPECLLSEDAAVERTVACAEVAVEVAALTRATPRRRGSSASSARAGGTA